MKNFKNKKPLIIFLLFLVVIYLFSFTLLPKIHKYYLLNTICASKAHMAKLLKIGLINTGKIKLITFRAGYHRSSTNLLTILSYINYLRRSGWNIKVKILHNKRITLTLNKVSNIGIVFSLIRTFKAFPLEIKKVSINTKNINKNINVIMNLKLISLRGLYK